MSNRALLMFAATGLVLAACGGDDDSAATTPTTSVAITVAVTAPDSASSQDNPAAPDVATVMIATNASLGEYLVDVDGRTLYLFDKDQGNDHSLQRCLCRQLATDRRRRHPDRR